MQCNRWSRPPAFSVRNRAYYLPYAVANGFIQRSFLYDYNTACVANERSILGSYRQSVMATLSFSAWLGTRLAIIACKVVATNGFSSYHYATKKGNK